MKKGLMSISLALVLAVCLSVAAFAAGNSAECAAGESAAAAQGYTLQAASTPNTVDTTRVKVDWVVTDAVVTHTPTITWNAETLQWVKTGTTYTATDGGATFTVTNYSSVNMKATASFAAADGMDEMVSAVTFHNNSCAIKTPVTAAKTGYADSDFTALAQTITATVRVNADRFAGLSDTEGGVLGTYTVSISEALSQKTIDSLKSTCAADASSVPAGLVIDKSAKSIAIQSAEAFLYYGLVYDNAAAVAAGNVAANSVVNVTSDIDFEYLTIDNGFAAQNAINGNGHTVKNLDIQGGTAENAAFFNTFNASVEDFVLDNIHVYGDAASEKDTAIMTASGSVSSCTVKNSSVAGGKYTAAIIAHCYGHATDCTVENTTISCAYKCGAIAAYTEGSTVAVDNNTVKNVTITADNCAGLSKDHYEIGYIVGDWNADGGTLSGNSAVNVTIINGDTDHSVTTDTASGNFVGYFDRALPN